MRPKSLTDAAVPLVDARLPWALSPAFASSSKAAMFASFNCAGAGAAVVVGVAAAAFDAESADAAESDLLSPFAHAAHSAHVPITAMLRARRIDIRSVLHTG